MKTVIISALKKVVKAKNILTTPLKKIIGAEMKKVMTAMIVFGMIVSPAVEAMAGDAQGGTGSESGSSTGTPTGTGTGTPTGTGAGSSAGAGTGTGTPTGTGSGSSTGTGTGTGSSAGAGAQVDTTSTTVAGTTRVAANGSEAGSSDGNKSGKTEEKKQPQQSIFILPPLPKGKPKAARPQVSSSSSSSSPSSSSSGSSPSNPSPSSSGSSSSSPSSGYGTGTGSQSAVQQGQAEANTTSTTVAGTTRVAANGSGSGSSDDNKSGKTEEKKQPQQSIFILPPLPKGKPKAARPQVSSSSSSSSPSSSSSGSSPSNPSPSSSGSSSSSPSSGYGTGTGSQSAVQQGQAEANTTSTTVAGTTRVAANGSGSGSSDDNKSGKTEEKKQPQVIFTPPPPPKSAPSSSPSSSSPSSSSSSTPSSGYGIGTGTGSQSAVQQGQAEANTTSTTVAGTTRVAANGSGSGSSDGNKPSSVFLSPSSSSNLTPLPNAFVFDETPPKAAGPQVSSSSSSSTPSSGHGSGSSDDNKSGKTEEKKQPQVIFTPPPPPKSAPSSSPSSSSPSSSSSSTPSSGYGIGTGTGSQSAVQQGQAEADTTSTTVAGTTGVAANGSETGSSDGNKPSSVFLSPSSSSNLTPLPNAFVFDETPPKAAGPQVSSSSSSSTPSSGSSGSSSSSSSLSAGDGAGRSDSPDSTGSYGSYDSYLPSLGSISSGSNSPAPSSPSSPSNSSSSSSSSSSPSAPAAAETGPCPSLLQPPLPRVLTARERADSIRQEDANNRCLNKMLSQKLDEVLIDDVVAAEGDDEEVQAAIDGIQKLKADKRIFAPVSTPATPASSPSSSPSNPSPSSLGSSPNSSSSSSSYPSSSSSSSSSFSSLTPAVESLQAAVKEKEDASRDAKRIKKEKSDNDATSEKNIDELNKELSIAYQDRAVKEGQKEIVEKKHQEKFDDIIKTGEDADKELENKSMPSGQRADLTQELAVQSKVLGKHNSDILTQQAFISNDNNSDNHKDDMRGVKDETEYRRDLAQAIAMSIEDGLGRDDQNRAELKERQDNIIDSKFKEITKVEESCNLASRDLNEARDKVFDLERKVKLTKDRDNNAVNIKKGKESDAKTRQEAAEETVLNRLAAAILIRDQEKKQTQQKMSDNKRELKRIDHDRNEANKEYAAAVADKNRLAGNKLVTEKSLEGCDTKLKEVENKYNESLEKFNQLQDKTSDTAIIYKNQVTTNKTDLDGCRAKREELLATQESGIAELRKAEAKESDLKDTIERLARKKMQLDAELDRDRQNRQIIDNEMQKLGTEDSEKVFGIVRCAKLDKYQGEIDHQKQVIAILITRRAILQKELAGMPSGTSGGVENKIAAINNILIPEATTKLQQSEQEKCEEWKKQTNEIAERLQKAKTESYPTFSFTSGEKKPAAEQTNTIKAQDQAVHAEKEANRLKKELGKEKKEVTRVKEELGKEKEEVTRVKEELVKVKEEAEKRDTDLETRIAEIRKMPISEKEQLDLISAAVKELATKK